MINLPDADSAADLNRFLHGKFLGLRAGARCQPKPVNCQPTFRLT